MRLPEERWLDQLEDQVQADAGVPVYCTLAKGNEVKGKERLHFIVPMDQEIAVENALRRSWERLSSIIPSPYRKRRFVLRTILYHMAYQRIGPLTSERDGYFVSSNFQNLDNPHRHPVGEAGRFTQLTYDIDAIIVVVRSGPADLVRFGEQLRDIARAFNDESRYLKIGELRFALTDSRFVVPKTQLQFNPVKLVA